MGRLLSLRLTIKGDTAQVLSLYVAMEADMV